MSGRQQYAVASVPPGYRIGPWIVEEPLGAGAFGNVYAARHEEPGVEPARAALKFLPTGTHTPRQLRHLKELAEREVALLRKLRSPRLIRMYDALTVDDAAHPQLDGAAVLVLEEARGSLDTLLDGPGPPENGPALLAQVCEGLQQLHAAGWVHGDLKPGNVLLMADGTARLGDFNLASELEGTHAYAPAFSTADYTPPELVWSEVGDRGMRIRPTADIWAFGVLAHLVLTGSFPLPGGTPGARRDAAVRYARGDEELRPSPELQGPWREIVTDCLARTHEERAVHDAPSLLRRAEAAAAGSAVRPRRSRRGRRRVPVRAVTAVAAAAAAAGIAGLVLALDAYGGPGGAAARDGYDRCVSGAVCFFSEEDGHGEMCSWVSDGHDWAAGAVPCAWAAARAPRSVYNNGHDATMGTEFVDVIYYTERKLIDRAGCVANRERRNLASEVVIKSHTWAVDCWTPPPRRHT